MNIYCPFCGKENLKQAKFCTGCGANLMKNNPVNNTNNSPNYNVQPQNYFPSKPYRNYKPIIAITVIAVVLVIISACLLVPMMSNSTSQIIKIPVDGGPKVSFQSLVSGGNAITLPDVGKTAVYGIYSGTKKIGSVSYTTVGEEYYEGQLCLKITMNGNFNLNIYDTNIGIRITGTSYGSESDLQMFHSEINMIFDSPVSPTIDMDMTVDVDEETGEITSTIYSILSGNVTSTMTVNDEYWSESNINYSDLYVGFSKEIPYIITTSGVDVDAIMTINVTNQEDVVVGKGTFDNCYLIEISQYTSGYSLTQKMWIDENGVCPKMELGNLAASVLMDKVTFQLEEYYTT